MKEIIQFITGNKNKLEELKAVMSNIEQLDVDLVEIQEVDAKKIIEAKLQEAIKHAKGSVIVEDTSLYLDCLNGLPGPLIKWFLKKMSLNDLYNIAKRLDNFSAEAKTIIGYSNGLGEIYFFEGAIKGKIISPRGKTNFGWDPIFQPEGFIKSFAELSSTEKNSISMRKIAIEKLKKHLLLKV